MTRMYITWHGSIKTWNDCNVIRRPRGWTLTSVCRICRRKTVPASKFCQHSTAEILFLLLFLLYTTIIIIIIIIRTHSRRWTDALSIPPAVQASRAVKRVSFRTSRDQVHRGLPGFLCQPKCGTMPFSGRRLTLSLIHI